MIIDQALKAHNCKHMPKNTDHRVLKGDKRLKLILADGNNTEEHFCKDCGLKMIESGIKELNSLYENLLKG